MKRTIAGVATSLLLLTAWPVSAEDVGDEEEFSSADPYFYLAGGLAVGGYVEIKDDYEDAAEERGSSIRVKRTETYGLDLRTGYRFNRNFAVEAQFQWITDTTIETEQFNLAKVEAFTVTGNLKSYLLTDQIEEFLDGRFSPYLLTGVGIMRVEVKDEKILGGGTQKDDDLVLRLGGGMDVFLIPNAGFYFDVTYLLTTGGVKRFDHVGLAVGAMYRF